MTAWLASFALTCAAELAVVIALGFRRPAVVLGAQLCTHPAAWIAVAHLPLPDPVPLIVVEIAATSIEAAIYRRWLGVATADAVAMSALANAASLAAAAISAGLLS